MYIGPLDPRNETLTVLSKDKTHFEDCTLTVSPGFVQVYNEILVNAIDRQFDVRGKDGMSRIDINVDTETGWISIENDGGTMPVDIQQQTGLYVPTMVFGEFLSGDNFDDSRERYVGGRNGVGAKATNAFSTNFQVEVSDPQSGKHFVQRWEGNMGERLPPEISELSAEVKRHAVKVSFQPDLPRFKLNSINMAHLRILEARAYDAAACTHSGVSVSFNGQQLPFSDFQDFAKSILGPALETETIVDSTGTVRAEIAAALSTKGSFNALGLVNGIRCSAGTHIQRVADGLAAGIAALATKRQSLAPSAVKRHLRVVVKVLVDRPDFDSQTKSRLTTTATNLGFDLKIPDRFAGRVAALGVLEASLKMSRAISQKSLLRSMSSLEKISAAKLDDATFAGKSGRNCTLILTEGDSAKALAVAGVSQVDRRTYGIFPLRGKLLNVRTATQEQLKNNEEAKIISQVVGLDWRRDYSTAQEVRSLRYQRILIFSDQDLDGHHIAGLIINFFHANWPLLLKANPDFIQRFATPIVKIFPKKSGAAPLQEFFTQGEFDAWQQEQPANWHQRTRVKYYKGLGTSTRAEAVEYFSHMDRHVIGLRYTGSEDDDSVERAFEKDRAGDRKEWLKSSNRESELDYDQSSVSWTEFFDRQFVHFSIYDCKRSIPLLLDGLKPSQRKVLHVVRRLKGERKVSQVTGLISAGTSYHHGEMSLVETIVSMAQTFVGTNNVNLLSPNGMFGSRLAGRSEHAQARYLYTEAAPLAAAVFVDEDDDVLRPHWEDGQLVEPKEFLPVVPMVLMNGFKGIGTGWATEGHNYHPLELTDALIRLVRGEEPGELLPWYDGFTGTIEADSAGKIWSIGRWRLYSSQEGGLADTVEITELPVGVWTEDYIKGIEKLANRSKRMLSIYKCKDNDDQHVHLLVGFVPDQLKKHLDAPNATEAVGDLLGLRKRVNMNMWLHHSEDGGEPVLMYFKTPQDVLRAFHSARRKHYERRLALLLTQYEHKVALARNRLGFIRACKDGSLQLSGLSEGEQEDALERAGFERLTKRPIGEGSGGQSTPGESEPDEEEVEDAGSFDYLLQHMTFRALTLEREDKLATTLQQFESELSDLESTSADELWLEDLQKFRKAYMQHKAVPQPAEPTVAQAKAIAKAAAEDKREAQKRFKSLRGRSQPSDHGLLGLTAQKADQLRATCKKHSLSTGGTKADLINRLLVFTTASNQESDWQGMSAEELRAVLLARRLPVQGQKAQLVERLVNAPGLHLTVERNPKEMKTLLKKYGLKCSYKTAAELNWRTDVVLQRHLEQERLLQESTVDELKERLQSRELQTTGRKDELILRLAIAEVHEMSGDLGWARKATTKKATSRKTRRAPKKVET